MLDLGQYSGSDPWDSTDRITQMRTLRFWKTLDSEMAGEE